MPQIPLIMPCLPCGPSCIWPPSPLNGILFSVAGLTNFVCLNCLDFNVVRLIPFKEVIPTFPITCIFELPIDEKCSSDRIRISTQEGFLPGSANITTGVGSDFPFLLFNGLTVLTPAEALTNGPFPLTLTAGSGLSCNLGAVVQTVEGLP